MCGSEQATAVTLSRMATVTNVRSVRDRPAFDRLVVRKSSTASYLLGTTLWAATVSRIMVATRISLSSVRVLAQSVLGVVGGYGTLWRPRRFVHPRVIEVIRSIPTFALDGIAAALPNTGAWCSLFRHHGHHFTDRLTELAACARPLPGVAQEDS